MSNGCPTGVPGNPPLPKSQLTSTYCLAHTTDTYFAECCPNRLVLPFNATDTTPEFDTPGCYQWCYVPGLDSNAAWQQTYSCMSAAASASGDNSPGGVLLCTSPSADAPVTSSSTSTSADAPVPSSTSSTSPSVDAPVPSSTSSAAAPDPTQRCLNSTMPYGLSMQPTTGVCALPNPDLIPAGANYSAPSNATMDVLFKCCDWSGVRWGVGHCWEYCYLPRGNNFRGKGNLTAEQAVGSFRGCVEQLQGDNDVMGEIQCGWDGAPMDLQTFNSSVTTWVLKDAAVAKPVVGPVVSLAYLALILWTLLR